MAEALVMQDEGYIAGGLFSDAQQKQRIYEKEVLEKNIKTVKFFNPLTDNKANDKSKLPTAKDIFIGDTERVLNSKYIVAEIDGEDAGVCMELGIAYGVNYMIDLLNQFKKLGCTLESTIEAIEMLVPKKEVMAHCSDIRLGTSGEYDGIFVPFGINQYLVGGILEMGKIYPHFEDVVDILKDRETK